MRTTSTPSNHGTFTNHLHIRRHLDSCACRPLSVQAGHSGVDAYGLCVVEEARTKRAATRRGSGSRCSWRTLFIGQARPRKPRQVRGRAEVGGRADAPRRDARRGPGVLLAARSEPLLRTSDLDRRMRIRPSGRRPRAAPSAALQAQTEASRAPSPGSHPICPPRSALNSIGYSATASRGCLTIPPRRRARLCKRRTWP